jgi:hypothetical protein
MDKYKAIGTIQLKFKTNIDDNPNIDNQKVLDFFLEWCKSNKYEFNGMQISFTLDGNE